MSYVNYVSHSRSRGIRQTFSPEEDAYLCSLVQQFGVNSWKFIAKKMPNRTTRQCRERYKNYLSPEIKNGPWTKEEDELLKEKYKEFGPKWAQISSFFNSRSDVNIKNRWASITAKKTSFDELSNSQSPIQNNSSNNSNQRDAISVPFNTASSSPDSPNNVNNYSENPLRNHLDVNIIIDDVNDRNSDNRKSKQILQNDDHINKNDNNREINNFDIQSPPPQPVSHSPPQPIHQDFHIFSNNSSNAKHSILNLKKHEDLLPPLTSKKHDADSNAIIDSSHPLFLETLLLADSSKNDDSTLPLSANGLVKTFPNYGGNVW